MWKQSLYCAFCGQYFHRLNSIQFMIRMITYAILPPRSSVYFLIAGLLSQKSCELCQISKEQVAQTMLSFIVQHKLVLSKTWNISQMISPLCKLSKYSLQKRQATLAFLRLPENIPSNFAGKQQTETEFPISFW